MDDIQIEEQGSIVEPEQGVPAAPPWPVPSPPPETPKYATQDAPAAPNVSSTHNFPTDTWMGLPNYHPVCDLAWLDEQSVVDHMVQFGHTE